jgi:hypothetical protein
VAAGFADMNPFTIVVNAVRALWLDAPADNHRGYRRAAVRA